MSDEPRQEIQLRKGSGDWAHMGIRAAITSAASMFAPGAGGAAAALFGSVFGQPLAKRRDDLLEDLAAWMFEHEAAINGIRTRVDDELIVSITAQAIAAAMKTHEREKREALRNAILNAVVGQSPAEAKAMMFVAWIDQFTEWHLRLLELLADPEEGLTREDIALVITRAGTVVERVYPELPSELVPQIFLDLFNRSLITCDSPAAGVPTNGASTPLGDEFLAFIAEPQVTEEAR